MKLPAARQRNRMASYALLSVALLVVAAYAGWLTLRLRMDQRDQAVTRAREELSALSQVWERSVLDRSAGWLSGLAQSADTDRRERAARASTPALRGLYLWTTGPDAPALQHPRGARPEPAPSPANAALSRALLRAQQLLLEDQPRRAWEALSPPGLPLYSPLSDGAAGVYSTRDLMRRRVLAAQALSAMGDRHRQRQLLDRTNAEISKLPPSLLGDALPWAYTPLLRELELVGDPSDIAETRAAFTAAAGRLEGVRAVEALLPALTAFAREDRRQSALAETSGQGDEDAVSPRDLLVENAASPRQGTVLLYALNPQGDLGLAALWSEAALHEELLGALPTESLMGAPVILDQDGEILAGGAACAHPEAPDAVWVRVPLSALLSHRRLGLCATADRPAPNADPASTVAAMAPIALALLLGGAALLARVSADQRQRELYERQRAFITRVTHELKTPLAGIRIMAETLELGAFRDAAQREALALRIQDEVDRLSTRIDEVLRVARTDELDGAEAVDLCALLTELVSIWRPRFEAVGARIETDLQPCPALLADRALLRDALNNLMDNALKYLREDRPGLLRVAARPEGRWLIVEVTDNGLGVPNAQRRAIFQPFVRVEGPGRGKAGGHGLGLSFVAETARAHGGTVECRDGLDGGAKFVLRFRRSSWKKGGSRASLSSKTTTPSP